MKKLLLFIAFAIFGFGLNAQNVGDETTIDYDDYSLKFKVTSVEPAECEVSGRTGFPTDVIIPSTVTVSGTEFNVTSIGERAFYRCSSLTSIDIPSSVTSIGDYAFRECSSLTSIDIPNSVTSIGDGAFYDCDGLTSIDIPSSVTSIGDNAFRECSSLTSIEIPNSVTSIGIQAISYCSSLTSIEIPNSVTSIGSAAFESCSSLTSIVVAEGNTVYDSRENCNAIIKTSSNTLIAGCQNTVIPNSVTSIGGHAFNYSYSLTSIEIPNSVTSIGDYAFSYCSSLTSIEIPNSVTSIGDKAFYGCSSLTSITFEENSQLTSIGIQAFSYCSSLTSIEIPNSVTTISYETFSGCSNLTSVIFEENSQLTTIAYSTFSGCSSLTSIEIPNSVTTIGNFTFEDCLSLTSIEIPNTVTSIGCSVFSGCLNLTSMVVEEGNPVYDSRDNSNAIIETATNTLISGYEYTIIPNSVTSIGNYAFSSCSSLTSIEIPNSVTTIGDYAFSSCSSLRVITCYAEDVPETGDYVFYNCPSDMIIYVPEVSLEDYKSASPWNAFTILSLNEAPRNIIATTDSAFSVNLSWDNCYADSYNVYRNGDSIANVTNPTYTDIDLEYNTEYCYTVTAVRNEIESDKSEEVCAKTFDLPITTPTNIVAEALSISSISLSWNEVENALSYNVYQADELIANVEETTFTIDSLEYNTEYCYTVTAVRNETESDKSEEKCVKTLDLPITTPENLVAEALSTSSIILTWDNVENALSYNVYRDGEMIINVTNTNYTDNNLEYNTEYCYTVTAVRNETESDKSEEKCVKTLGESINELSSSINIYPNPVENELFIATEMNVKEVAIYDVYGRLTMSLQVNETTSQQVVEVADLEAGVYFVKVVTNAGEIVKRFVKKRDCKTIC